MGFLQERPRDGYFAVAAYKRGSFATFARAPPWVTSQQSAELYAVFHTIRQLILRSSTHACLAVDNSAAYYSVLSGRVSGRCPERVRILRRINRLCLEGPFQLQLVLVPSCQCC